VLEANFAKHRKEARAEGGVRSLATAVLELLAEREVPVGDVERVRILGEQDPAVLHRWYSGLTPMPVG
jgi:hypothetical protein